MYNIYWYIIFVLSAPSSWCMGYHTCLPACLLGSQGLLLCIVLTPLDWYSTCRIMALNHLNFLLLHISALALWYAPPSSEVAILCGHHFIYNKYVKCAIFSSVYVKHTWSCTVNFRKTLPVLKWGFSVAAAVGPLHVSEITYGFSGDKGWLCCCDVNF